MNTTFKLEEQCILKHAQNRGNPSVSDLVMQIDRDSDAHLEYMCRTDEQAIKRNNKNRNTLHLITCTSGHI